jgi:hypothetical protein
MAKSKGQTTQWTKEKEQKDKQPSTEEKVQKDKQRSTKHTHKFKIEYHAPH